MDNRLGKRPGSLKTYFGVPLWLAPIVLSGVLTGCSAFEGVCRDGEIPVLQLEERHLTGGSKCVFADEEPGPGYVRFPDDLEPKYQRDFEVAVRRSQDRLDRGEWQP